DRQLGVTERADGGVRPSEVAPIRPRARRITAEAEARHEHGEDQRRGEDGVAEQISELPNPDDLVDQAARAREEEQQRPPPHRGRYYHCPACSPCLSGLASRQPGDGQAIAAVFFEARPERSMTRGGPR